MIKAILFDIDGVLLDSFDANLDFYQRLMALAGYQGPTREEYIPFFHRPMRDLIAAHTQAESPEEIQRIWEMGCNREGLYDHALLSMPTMTEEIISSLHTSYHLGVVTSRVISGVYTVPALKNLERYFSTLVAYEDTEHHKPHPAPLLLAAQRLACAPPDCVYIGDAPTDMIAAQEAGMQRILFSTTIDIPDVVRATSFTGLPDIIAAL